ncbi:hypothetical protein CAEBREN_12528 [Caenorhabditis brenneri]|uniref:Uncharacterized protein n=1 Tax=Caenorhabditis brenneri TaxID=135651 RepID=G0MD36_CAEBE|nr:hypothetical protein CAEBREN_12528 [Caenorhabditis brenneri]
MKQLIALLCLSSPLVFSFSNIPICTNGFTLINNKCLKLFDYSVPHGVAEKICRHSGATLVTAKSLSDNQAISTIAAKSVALIWIGLYCADSDSSKCLWDDASGAANMYNSFAADDCTFNYNGNCYTFNGTNATFIDAQTTCEQECGNLVSINSELENRYISAMAERLWTPRAAYIGATITAASVSWLYSWTDGSRWTYSNIDNMMYKPCFTMMIGNNYLQASGAWFGYVCEWETSFVCKRPAGLSCDRSQPVVPVTDPPARSSFCNSSLLFAPGVISSPNYPDNYENNVDCEYHLSTIGSYNIALSFLGDFVTEECCDKVYVYDGDSTSSPLIGVYSGTLDTFNLVSTGNTMTVVFKTNSEGVARGFNARFVSYSG